MSKYTTEVRFICETASGCVESVGFNAVDEIISKAIPSVFNFDFPIYDESYRNVLCSKILKHYYTREICAETVGLWKLWLSARLNEIMPYYNQLYKSTVLEFNPMYDFDLTTTYTKDNSGSSSNNGSSTHNAQGHIDGVSRDMFSDTPQGALDNLENETYLTNARKVAQGQESSETNSSSFKGANTVKNTEEYVQKVVGKSGGVSYSKRLQEFRNTFLNIDCMIIDELKDLFFNLW